MVSLPYLSLDISEIFNIFYFTSFQLPLGLAGEGLFGVVELCTLGLKWGVICTRYVLMCQWVILVWCSRTLYTWAQLVGEGLFSAVGLCTCGLD